MEATSLCIRLLIKVLWLLLMQVKNNDSAQKDAGPVILEGPGAPVTEGDTVTLGCSINRTLLNQTADFCKDDLLIGISSTGILTLSNVSMSHAGSYSCRISGAGESANRRLSVEADPVILDSPVLPVTEGDSVTLRCRKRKAPSHQIADFYKHGYRMGTGYKGELTIHNVAKTDEGPYRCSISGDGDSAERWLRVRVVTVTLKVPSSPVVQGDDVTLQCLNRADVNVPADFYKDGLFIGNSTDGNFTLSFVTKSDEGLYSCSISGAGGSVGNRLTVREFPLERLCSDQLYFLLFFFIRTVASVFWVALLLLMTRKCHKDD